MGGQPGNAGRLKVVGHKGGPILQAGEVVILRAPVERVVMQFEQFADQRRPVRIRISCCQRARFRGFAVSAALEAFAEKLGLAAGNSRSP
jgi:hypothetical protein